MGATVKPVAPPSFCQRSRALARCARIKAVESARKLLCLCTTAKWSPARGSHSRVTAREVCDPAEIFSSRLVRRCEPQSCVAAARPSPPRSATSQIGVACEFGHEIGLAGGGWGQLGATTISETGGVNGYQNFGIDVRRRVPSGLVSTIRIRGGIV